MAVPYAAIIDAKVQVFGDFHAGTGGPVLLDEKYGLLRHFRYGKLFDSFDPAAVFERSIDGEFNYVGPTLNHFGHIMSEMVHRVLPSRRVFGHDRWLAVAERATPGADYAHLGTAYRSAIEFLGVNEGNLTVINRNTIVARLNIHQQQSQLGVAAGAEYLAELNDYTAPRLDALYGAAGGHAKVYVSRTGMERGGNILGERYIASMLENEGFTIFQPELHPLTVQMDVYRKAGMLVFSEGSACHGVEFLGPVLGDVFLIQRRPEAERLFQCALAPRARSYVPCGHPIYVGTAALHPFEDRALAEWGESLVDVARFLAFMREHGIARMTAFDPARYFETALQDLEAYIAFHQNNGSRLVPPEELVRMRAMVSAGQGLHDPA